MGAGHHAIALFSMSMVVSLGFCTPIHYILWLIVRTNGRILIYVVVMRIL